MRHFSFRTRSRDAIRAENREELEAWIDERADELAATGLSQDAARRQALDEFGDVVAAARYADRQDAAADHRIRLIQWVEESAADIRIAFRMLGRAPVVTTVVLLTLALGVGVTTAVFSVAHALLLRPLPYGSEHSLAYLAATDEGAIRSGSGGGRHSATALIELRQRTSTFTDIAGITMGTGILRGDGDPEQVWAASVTVNAFDVLQAGAVRGRTFNDDDTGGNVAVLTDGLWRRRFNADPAIVGRSIDYGGAQLEVIGVMPPGFRFPTYEATELATPQRLENILRGASSRHLRFLRLFGRMSGHDHESVQADLDRVMRMLASESPRDFDRVGTRLVPIRTAVAGDARPGLLVLMGAALFVLLIACANVAGVLLSRSVARHSELAVRAALGAGRGRLIRHLLAEGVVLAALGAALGLLVTQLGVAFLRAVAETTLPAGTVFGVESRVAWFGIGTAVVTALVATLLPALTATHRIGSPVGRAVGRATTSRSQRLARLSLVAAQLAVTIVLLVGAGLLLRSLQRLQALDLGYATDHALTFRPQFTAPKSNAEQDSFYEALYANLRRIPGVVAVGGGNVPTGGVSSLATVVVEGRGDAGRPPDVRYTPASDEYFAALRIPLIRGRTFSATDREGAPRVAVVSVKLAQQLWPDGNPIGARVRVAPDRPWATIVGIVGDVRMGGAETPNPSIYTSQRQDHWPGGAPIVVRTDGEPANLTGLVRETVKRTDPAVVIPSIRTLDDVRSTTPAVADRHVHTQLMVVFSVVALVVSAIGVYGVGAYATQSRAMEFGIRIALGASRSSILWLAIRDSVRVALLGTLAGIPLAWMLARRLRGLLFSVQPFDGVTSAASLAVLALIVLAASLIPARRAVSIEPARTIRAD